MSDNQNSLYSNSIVSFVDMLGFAECVIRSETDTASMVQIKNFLDINARFQNYFEKTLNDGKNILVNASYFSDTFVLSVPDDRIIYLLRETGHLCRHMLLSGWPCRGAVVVGSLAHSKQAVLGPALVEAYRLEQRAAIYPRVLLDNEALIRWQRETDSGSSTEAVASIVKRDKDEMYYLDLFDPAWSQFLDPLNEPNWEPIPDFINATKGVIELGLQQNAENSGVHQKYEWLKSEWQRHQIDKR